MKARSLVLAIVLGLMSVSAMADTVDLKTFLFDIEWTTGAPAGWTLSTGSIVFAGCPLGVCKNGHYTPNGNFDGNAPVDHRHLISFDITLPDGTNYTELDVIPLALGVEPHVDIGGNTIIFVAYASRKPNTEGPLFFIGFDTDPDPARNSNGVFISVVGVDINIGNFTNIRMAPMAVPEPATLTLLAAGLLVGAAFRKRFR